MFDGLKLRIQGRDQEPLRSHVLLSFTVEPDGKHRARWGAFTFTGDALRCWEVQGSFHYFHHGTNWPDFTRSQFVAAVSSMCVALGLHDASVRLANVEVGVNVRPPLPSVEVLRSIVFHRTQRATGMGGGAVGIEIRHNGYRFKVYDKAHQFELPYELLRFEIAVRKMRTLAPFGIRTLADLSQPATWTAMHGYLLARFDELFIMEPSVNVEHLRPAQRALLIRAKDPRYLLGLSRQRRAEKLAALRRIFDKYAEPNLRETLRALIDTKAADVSERNAAVPEHLTPDNCPDVAAELPGTSAPGVGEDATRTKTPFMVKGATVTGNGAEEAKVEAVRRCRACGRDISDQRSTSKSCSEGLYGLDGKACRNRASNLTRTLRKIERRGSFLFDHTPFLRESLGTPHRRVRRFPGQEVPSDHWPEFPFSLN